MVVHRYNWKDMAGGISALGHLYGTQNSATAVAAEEERILVPTFTQVNSGSIFFNQRVLVSQVLERAL